MATKKLIEVALPLEKINAESAREKSIRFGHPSTLHLWWARRPLAAARAVIWSSLVDDPSSKPELYPTEEEQKKERERLFRILEDLVLWDNSNNPEIIKAAKAEIEKSCGGKLPELLDPFAGGGAIPLEAQRLGLKAHAHDLNPIAVLINKAMIEIPPRFSNNAPINGDDRISRKLDTWIGTQALAADIQYYGKWIKSEAYKRIGHLYPQVKIPKEQGGKAPVIAWIWARTVKCPNPACGCEMPLMGTYLLSNKRGKEAWVEPKYKDGKFRFIVQYGKFPKEAENGSKMVNGSNKGAKGTFCCPLCKSGIVKSSYIDDEANAGRMGAIPVAVVADVNRKRMYYSVDDTVNNQLLQEINSYYEAYKIAKKVPHEKTRGTFASNAQGGFYGFHEFKDYFTLRQQIALTTFSDLIKEAMKAAEIDAIQAGMKNDHIGLNCGGSGAKAYSEAIAVYLMFGLSRMINANNSLCRWTVNKTQVIPVFSRQAIPMVWDYAENNVFNNAAGDFEIALGNIVKAIERFPINVREGVAIQHDAQTDTGMRNIIISTDPPYYDNIVYSDLSDFFYVWVRKTFDEIYPELFRTVLVPKAEELIATPYRHDGDIAKAKVFFENGMLETCKQLYKYTSDNVPVTIYFAYKQSDTDVNDKKASSGWETMLTAVISAGFSITGTWPMRTEMANRAVASGAHALASSIVLVCRKRPEDAPQTTRRNLINSLRRELRPALKKLQDSNIAPVDLAQSAIGPGMGVYSRYKKVLEADGSPMSVRNALHIINEEIDLYFNEQVGDLDSMSRFCVDLYTQNAFNDIKFGDADILARAKGTSVAALASHGIVYAKAGTVHLIERTELPEKIDENENCIWMLTQQLTQAMATGGVEACAKAVFMMFGSNAERAKDLAYRLYTIAEQKKWSTEAYAYNALVVAWPDIQSRAAMMQREKPEQMDMFSMGLLDT